MVPRELQGQEQAQEQGQAWVPESTEGAGGLSDTCVQVRENTDVQSNGKINNQSTEKNANEKQAMVLGQGKSEKREYTGRGSSPVLENREMRVSWPCSAAHRSQAAPASLSLPWKQTHWFFGLLYIIGTLIAQIPNQIPIRLPLRSLSLSECA